MINQITNGMNAQKEQLYFLLVILAGVFVLVFFIFRPFLYALVFATVFSIVFQPVYKKIMGLTYSRQGLSAFATILIVLIFIFTPLMFLGVQIFQEAEQLYLTLMTGDGKDAILGIFNNIMNSLQSVADKTVGQNFSLNADRYLKQGLEWLLQNLDNIFSNFANLLVNFLIFLVALYYLFKDGQKLKKTVIALSPLTDIDDETIFKKLEVAVNSVMKGNLIIAVVQGAFSAMGFLIFGVPNAALWGSVAAIAALIPGIGTMLVLIPAIIFLFLTSGFLYSFGLFMWGVVVVGLVDNFLRPKFISTDTQLHPLIILLSALGGMLFFGPIGFLLGPLILSLFFALLDIYFSLRKQG